MTTSRSYLIVGPSWVGDMVMAQSLFMRLKALHPDAAIDVLAPAWSEPLLARMPQVRDSIVMPLGHGQLDLAVRYRVGKSLRGCGYSHAIVLPNSFKSALVPLWAHIPVRSGFVGEWRYGLLNDIRKLDKKHLRMTVQRYVALAEPASRELPYCPSPQLQTSAADKAAALERHGLVLEAPVLALCPGAEYGPAKRWPAEHYAAVARQYLQQGWQVWLFGSGKDRSVSEEINALAGGGCTDLAGRTSLAEAIDLLAQAQAVVSNDSGLMHVAAALGRPLVAVYGSSDPGFTPPLSTTARVLNLGLECSPCFKRDCPLDHLNCLRQLEPERVVKTLETLSS
jgi:heptosyltransferase-2